MDLSVARICRFSTSASEAASYTARPGKVSADSPCVERVEHGQIIGVDVVALGEHDRAFDNVFQFPHVARPAIVSHAFESIGCESTQSSAGFGVESFQKVDGQFDDIFGAFPQGRNIDFNHAESKIQIAAKLSFRHRFLEITIRGGDHADVDFDGLIAADSFERMALEHAEELGLDGRAHLADFVEHQGSLMGRFKLADLTVGGAGEGASFVAEEFAFEQ